MQVLVYFAPSCSNCYFSRGWKLLYHRIKQRWQGNHPGWGFRHISIWFGVYCPPFPECCTPCHGVANAVACWFSDSDVQHSTGCHHCCLEYCTLNFFDDSGHDRILLHAQNFRPQDLHISFEFPLFLVDILHLLFQFYTHAFKYLGLARFLRIWQYSSLALALWFSQKCQPGKLLWYSGKAQLLTKTLQATCILLCLGLQSYSFHVATRCRQLSKSHMARLVSM